MLAEGFIAWRRTATPTDGGAPDEMATFWLRHGILHLCRADGQGAKVSFSAQAAHVYATDLALLRERIDRGLLSIVAKDYLELRGVDGVDLTDVFLPPSLPPSQMATLLTPLVPSIYSISSWLSASFKKMKLPEPQTMRVEPTHRADGILVWAEARVLLLRFVTPLECSRRLLGRSLRACCTKHRACIWLLEGELHHCRALVTLQHVHVLAHKLAHLGRVAGFEDGTIKVWPGPPHRALRIAPPSPKLKPAGLSGRRAGAAERKDGPINSVAFSPDGTNIFSGLYDHGTI
jgi:hypothetical protein